MRWRGLFEDGRGDRSMRRYVTYWLCLMLVLSIFSIAISFWGEVATANPPMIDGGTTYWDQDWYVDNVQEYINQTIILSGNLTINETGSLNLYNVTLVMNCTYDGQYKIEVKSGGGLYIYDNDNSRTTIYDASKLTANNTDYEYLFWIRADSDFSIKNSELHECGYDRGTNGELAGLWVNSNNSVIENNFIASNYNGIILYQTTNCIIRGNTITDCRGKNGSDGTIGDGEPGDAGAGIYIKSSENIEVTDNELSNNRGGNGGKNGTNSSGGAGGLGAGIYVSMSNNITITNNIIYENFGGQGGGTGPRSSPWSSLFLFNNSGGIGAGIYLFSSDNIIIEDNKISNNTGGSGGGILVDSDDYAHGNEGGRGAGIYLHDSSNNQIINNEILGNGGGDGGYLLQDMGGGIFVATQMDGGTGAGVRLAKSNYNEIVNNTITGSRGGDGTAHLFGNFGYYNAGIGLYLNGSYNRIINCTIWNNSRDADGAGIYVASYDDQIINAQIENNYIGIYVLRNSVTVINSTILNSTEYDFWLSCNTIFLEAGTYFHTTAINTTFNESKIRFGEIGPSSYSDLTVQWYLSVYVNNSFGDPLSGANINVCDNDNGTYDHNYTTNGDGYVRWILATEYIQNDTSKTYYTPHNITAEKTGYNTVTVNPVINQNTFVNITLGDIEKPTADAGPDAHIYEDGTHMFDGSNSTDNTGILFYNWSFGDGTFENGSNKFPVHSYDAAGSYIVTLNVTDALGNWDTDTCRIFVENIPPIANAGYDKVINEGEEVIFDGHGSTDTPSDLPNLIYTWHFGDGNSIIGVNGTHIFGDNGNYTILLVVTDDDDYVDVDTVNVTVKNVAPTIESINPQQISEGEAFTYHVKASDVPGDIITFFDNTTMFDIDPRTGIIQFIPTDENVGVHYVNISVMDDDGGVNFTTLRITVLSSNDTQTTEPTDFQVDFNLVLLIIIIVLIALLIGYLMGKREKEESHEKKEVLESEEIGLEEDESRETIQK